MGDWVIAVDGALVRRLAEARSRRHRGDPSRRLLLPSAVASDEAGVAVELAFAGALGLPTAGVAAAKGRGCEFVLADGTRVDCRGSPNPKAIRLAVDPAKLAAGRADAYVFGRYDAARERVHLRGWATAAEMAAAPLGKISEHPRALPVRYRYLSELRPLAELRARHVPATLAMFAE